MNHSPAAETRLRPVVFSHPNQQEPTAARGPRQPVGQPVFSPPTR